MVQVLQSVPGMCGFWLQNMTLKSIMFSSVARKTADLLLSTCLDGHNIQELNSLVSNFMWMETSLSLLELNCDI